MKVLCIMSMQGGEYRTVGERITRGSMTCPIPREALAVHDRQLNFSNLPHEGANFSSLPLGGARQIYTVSVSNNGRDFSSSQTFTLYNSTCYESCSSSGVTLKVCQLLTFSSSLLYSIIPCHVKVSIKFYIAVWITEHDVQCTMCAHSAFKLATAFAAEIPLLQSNACTTLGYLYFVAKITRRPFHRRVGPHRGMPL